MPGYYLQSLLSPGARIPLLQHGRHSCGRSKGNKIRLQHELISSQHCVFLVTPKSIQIMDLQSLYGTYVNGHKIESNILMELKKKNIVGIGYKKTNNLSSYNYVYSLEKYELKEQEPWEEIDRGDGSAAESSGNTGEKSNTSLIIDLTGEDSDDDVEVKELPQENFLQVKKNLTTDSANEEKPSTSGTMNNDNNRHRKSIEDMDRDRENKKFKTERQMTECSEELENIKGIPKEDPQQVNENVMIKLVKEEKLIAPEIAHQREQMIRKSTEKMTNNNKRLKTNEHSVKVIDKKYDENAKENDQNKSPNQESTFDKINTSKRTASSAFKSTAAEKQSSSQDGSIASHSSVDKQITTNKRRRYVQENSRNGIISESSDSEKEEEKERTPIEKQPSNPIAVTSPTDKQNSDNKRRKITYKDLKHHLKIKKEKENLSQENESSISNNERRSSQELKPTSILKHRSEDISTKSRGGSISVDNQINNNERRKSVQENSKNGIVPRNRDKEATAVEKQSRRRSIATEPMVITAGNTGFENKSAEKLTPKKFRSHSVDSRRISITDDQVKTNQVIKPRNVSHVNASVQPHTSSDIHVDKSNDSSGSSNHDILNTIVQQPVVSTKNSNVNVQINKPSNGATSKSSENKELIKKKNYRIPKIAQSTTNSKNESVAEEASSSKVCNDKSLVRKQKKVTFSCVETFSIGTSSSKVYNDKPHVRQLNNSKLSPKESFSIETISSKVYNDNSRVQKQNNVKASPKETFSMEASSSKMPNHNLHVAKRTIEHVNPKSLEPVEFLMNICQWDPNWLYNSEFNWKSKQSPSFIGRTLVPRLTSYKSFGAYYGSMSTFLLLELWAHIFKNFNEVKNKPTFLAAINKNSSSIPVQNKGTLTEFTIEILRTRDQINNSAFPKPEDLVILSNQKKLFQPMFAYIKAMDKTHLTGTTTYNKCLTNTVHNPSVLITYTVIADSLPSNLVYEEIQTLQFIFSMSRFIRLINATLCLKGSSLESAIANVKANTKIFSLPTTSNYESYQFITGDKLNEKQKKAVVQITDAVVECNNKICLIDGPPGTGKTQMIVNIVTEIIYGNNRMKDRKLKRILICSPSNAATDEVTIRLLDVLEKIKAEGSQQPFRIVRVGSPKPMHPKVVDISLHKLLATPGTQNIPMSASIQDEMNLLKDKINKVKELMNSQKNIPEDEHARLKKQYEGYITKLELLENCNRSPIYNEKTLNSEQNILTNAHIITCTLSSCFLHEMKTTFSGNRQFQVCIVDDASLCNEPESLLPLNLGVKQLILVGDSNQLPISTVSKVAKANSYHKSLFTRINERFDLLDDDNPIITLDTQYRSAEEIISWPKQFLRKTLKTDAPVPNSWPFHGYRVFAHNSAQSSSTCNFGEANFIAKLIYTIIQSGLDLVDGCIRIGVITPYNEQRKLLSILINKSINELPDNIKNQIDVQVNSTDWVRGQEFDIVILSCTRSRDIGYLADIQRLQHIFTRAKYSLFLCGNFNFYRKDINKNDEYMDSRKSWDNLLKHAKDSYIFVDYKMTTRDMKESKLVMKLPMSTDI